MRIMSMCRMKPGRFVSQRDAYALIDSLNHDQEGRRAIQALGLSTLLQPNIVEDKEGNKSISRGFDSAHEFPESG